MRSPLSNINVNIDKSPNRKRGANSLACSDEPTVEKKALVQKENYSEPVFGIRETEL